jgi:MinD superfamily P-loop ATPase
MVKRTIVKMDEKKCTGCGKCVAPCAEGAIQIIYGKARVLSEELCDGMGFCIELCPEGAISVEERHTIEFNREKTDQPQKKYAFIHCFSCGAGENNNYLLLIRHKRDNFWVCTRRLPKIIHG